MTLEAIVFLAVAAVVGYLVHRREGIGSGVAAAAAVIGVLCLLSWGSPSSTPTPPAAPEGTHSEPSTPPARA